MNITKQKLGRLIATVGAALVLSSLAQTAFAVMTECGGAAPCRTYWSQKLSDGRWTSGPKANCVSSAKGYKWKEMVGGGNNMQSVLACTCPANTDTTKYSCLK